MTTSTRRSVLASVVLLAAGCTRPADVDQLVHRGTIRGLPEALEAQNDSGEAIAVADLTSWTWTRMRLYLLGAETNRINADAGAEILPRDSLYSDATWFMLFLDGETAVATGNSSSSHLHSRQNQEWLGPRSQIIVEEETGFAVFVDPDAPESSDGGAG